MNGTGIADLLLIQTIQVSALAAMVWLLVRFTAKDRPHLAHALWALVLLKCVTPPVFASPISPFSWCWDAHRTIGTREPSAGDRDVMEAGIADAANKTVKRPIRFPTSSQHALFGGGGSSERSAGLSRSEILDEQDQQRHDRSLASVAASHSYFRITTWIGWIWGVGIVVSLLATAIRLTMFLHRVRATTSGSCDELSQSTNRLAKRLGLRRKVRVTIVDSKIGPAVVGLLRPRILLPQLIVEGKTPADVEPLIAHELIHIRRGDLCWAVLQTIAVASAWFNPLIWIASRLMTRETERSCDEETIASLGCRPATYARSLLEVLERKHQLRVAPALPGVRPVDITANRMERIMRLGQGSHRRRPWWVGVVLLAGSAITLPGASWVTAQQQHAADAKKPQAQGSHPHPAISDDRVWPAPQIQPADTAPTLSVMAGDGDLKGRPKSEREAAPDIATQFRLASFEVGDVIDKEHDAFGTAPADAGAAIISLLPRCRHWSVNTPTTPSGVELNFGVDGHGIQILGNREPPIKLVGQTLHVFSTSEHHQKVRNELQRIRDHGFEQVTVEISILSLPAELMGRLEIDWTIDQPGRDKVKPVSYLQSQGGGLVPTSLVSTLNPQQLAAFRRQVQSDDKAVILSAPKVTVWNGRHAEIFVGQQRPFVVSLRPEDESQTEFEPVIQTVHEGVHVGVKPVFDAATNKVQLTCDLQMTDIKSVNAFTFKRPGGKNGDTLTVQTPQLKSQRLETAISLGQSESLVIGGPQQVVNDELMATLVTFTVTVIDPSQQVAGRDEPTLASPGEKQPAAIPTEANAPDHQGVNVPLHLETPGDDVLDALIVCEGPDRDAQDLKPLIEELTKLNIAGQFLGQLEYEIDDGVITIRGRGMRIRAGSGSISCSCDQGILRLRPETDQFDAELRGNVQLSFEDEAKYFADEIAFDSDVDKLSLNGNVRATLGDSTLRCDRLIHELENRTLEISGHAQLTKPRGNVPPGHYQADFILWDQGKDELRAMSLPQLSMSLPQPAMSLPKPTANPTN